MTRAIRSLNKGRLRVWWIYHRQDAIRTLQLAAIVLLFLVASSMDYRDQVAAERAAHEAVREQLRDERAARGHSRTVYLIEAATPEAARMKLAEIAGEIDLERAKLRSRK
jgi:hypothetical protein